MFLKYFKENTRRSLRHALRSSASSLITLTQRIRSWKRRVKYLSILVFRFTHQLQRHSSGKCENTSDVLVFLVILSFRFLCRRFLRAAHASDLQKPRVEMEFLANYLIELTLIDYEFLKFLPSVIAASAVFLAKWTLNQSSHPWVCSLFGFC